MYIGLPSSAAISAIPGAALDAGAPGEAGDPAGAGEDAAGDGAAAGGEEAAGGEDAPGGGFDGDGVAEPELHPAIASAVAMTAAWFTPRTMPPQ